MGRQDPTESIHSKRSLLVFVARMCRTRVLRYRHEIAEVGRVPDGRFDALVRQLPANNQLLDKQIPQQSIQIGGRKGAAGYLG